MNFTFFPSVKKMRLLPKIYRTNTESQCKHDKIDPVPSKREDNVETAKTGGASDNEAELSMREYMQLTMLMPQLHDYLTIRNLLQNNFNVFCHLYSRPWTVTYPIELLDFVIDHGTLRNTNKNYIQS
jgi:hypothetical protein